MSGEKKGKVKKTGVKGWGETKSQNGTELHGMRT